ncbi:SDR family NAD(P)-dependent oxidoreductase [Subtercola lobariae]|uniref:3-oxoacyl-ACP reductase n=1 Tax=Subtercola lobariae TaxID=1588641 RepID=A0A917F161_9MICO|nr:SDR family oxidoreductase [Subtercola lobariae]GGF38031.1 3-oxoacyl-ACP reductase [Subtercola lobariae]
MDLGLDGKVVLVTGAARGIGLAIVTAFAAEGAQVVAADLNEPEIPVVAARPPVFTAVDFTVPQQIESWVADAAAQFGAIDVLVNNVGLAPYRDGFLNVTDAQWKALLEVNLFAMIRTSRAVIPHMVKGGGGALVNLASDAGRQPDPFFVDYAVTKSAVLSLSKSLSIEFGPKGIRSNCISPGPTATPAMDDFLVSMSKELGKTFDETKTHFARDMRQLPLGRMNEPEDVAAAAVFLASAPARQITGAAYPVDAGSHRYV